METRELRYFVAVAEEGHVSRAAERLGMAQPPLSRAIAQLERRLGAELFVRTPRGVTLTRAGETLLREGRAALAAVEAEVTPRVAEAERLRAEKTAALDKAVREYDATLAANTAAISAQIARVVDPDGSRGARFVDNREWTAELTLLDFLRDVGKHVTVNQMVHRDSVRARLDSEQGISYTEFSYMLLQAHDYLHLHRSLGVELQVVDTRQVT